MYIKGEYYMVNLCDHVTLLIEYENGDCLYVNGCQVRDFKGNKSELKEITLTLPDGKELLVNFNDKDIRYFCIRRYEC